VRHGRILDHLDIRSRDEGTPMTWGQFLFYLVIMLFFFYGFWKAIDAFFESVEKRNDRKLQEKVDRYRRGNR
jgi:hypothetical protein